MHLFPEKKGNGEYFFRLSGSSALRAPETIIAANALFEAGYPVEINEMDEITDRIEGNDAISVVPINDCSLFSEEIYLPEGAAGRAVAEKTEWSFDSYQLKV